MIKKFAKRFFWLFAGSDNMLVRRPAWRLLRFFEKISPKHKPDPEAKAHHNSDSGERGHNQEQLIQLYNATIEQRTIAPKPNSFYLTNQAQPQEKRRRSMIVVVPSLPKHDRTSSGLRICCLLKSFCSHFERIHLVYHAISEEDPIYKRTFPANLGCHHISLTDGKLERFISDAKPEILLVTDLFDAHYIEQCHRIVKTTKDKFPDSFVIIDTMDCHWKKYVRKAEASSDPIDWEKACQYLQLETALYPSADLLTVVTAEEGGDITFSIPGSPDTAVLPNCYTLSPNLPDFEQTAGLCFVGPAGVNHNLDAMRYMRDSVLPHLLDLDRNLNMFVVGSGWEAHSEEFRNLPFVFRGHAADLDGELSKYRVFVCPLTYGAGLKGKLGSAASAGIPVVSTSIGCEGYPISPSEECLIADEPKLFAQHCERLLHDESLWVLKRDQLRNMMEHNFGKAALDHCVAKIIQKGLEK